MPRAMALLLVALTLSCATAPRSRDPLYDEIARLDREMFAAFNAHDIDKVASYFDERLEFYHDTGGVLSYADAIGGMRSNFEKNNGLRRDLVEGSLEVYPIRDYGAVEIGAHRFCHVENGRNDCGVFKFVHVWQKQPGGWKITRVVSYDH
ncbi:MAG TPA: nuclear transport factor 2 family protein [Vicinamibacterales bacterium]|nr:nuclear transport factor 2 family protein [Vicinamibacterales bacterium]